MDYKTFKRHLGKAGLRIGDFARIAGVKANAVSNYSTKGEVPPAYALLAVCFGEIVDSGGNLMDLLARHGALSPDYYLDPKNASVINLEAFKEIAAARDVGTSVALMKPRDGRARDR